MSKFVFSTVEIFKELLRNEYTSKLTRPEKNFNIVLLQVERFIQVEKT
jgi:hypothetical protein